MCSGRDHFTTTHLFHRRRSDQADNTGGPRAVTGCGIPGFSQQSSSSSSNGVRGGAVAVAAFQSSLRLLLHEISRQMPPLISSQRFLLIRKPFSRAGESLPEHHKLPCFWMQEQRRDQEEEQQKVGAPKVYRRVQDAEVRLVQGQGQMLERLRRR